MLSGGPIVGAGTTYTATLTNPLPVGSYKPGLAISSAADTFVLNLQDGSTVTWTINDAPSELTAGSPGIYPAKAVGSPVTGITITVDSGSGGVGLKSITVDNEVLVDGQITAKLLVDKITEQDGVGTLFYDENIGGVTTLLRLMNRYGFKGAKPGCGIYALTEQPNFDVANYIKSGDYYVPTRSYSRLFKCLLKAVAVDWAATTAFTKDQIVEYNDFFYCVTADHTTGSSFATDNLHIIETVEAFATAFAPAGQTSSSSGGGGGSY